jgi:excisionase family DNA binding protein
MKAELIFPDDMVKAIAQEVIAALKPVLARRIGEEDAILTPDQLAGLLGVSKGWVYEQAALKAIPYHKLGKYLRFRRSEIGKWIDSAAVPASGPPSRALRIAK